MDPASEHRLDQLLEAWAQAQRIRDDESEAVRTAILRTPKEGASPPGVDPGLDPLWWRAFTTQIAEVVVQAGAAARQPVQIAYSGV